MNFVCLSEPNRHLHVSLVALLALCALSSGCEEETAANNQDHAAQEATARDLTAHTHEGGESCFICDPSQREAGRLWCEEHGRYEDRCWECQPQLRDADRSYCEEHGLYEDECFLCDPSRAEATAATAPGGSTP